MFSWITGPRITNVIEDLSADAGYETTFIEQPETPAPQFAVKAFKHVLFGTPAPEETNNAGKKLKKKQSPDAINTDIPEIAAPKENVLPSSPSKQPNGILRTPKTANKAQKNVSFGAHVVDNEGKRGNASKSGIPNDCPGKFPSPWTPGTELKADVESGKKSQNKLTAALLDARTATQPKRGQKAKARDDSDITMDLGAPRSESGKYWKEQYESYAERSEKEMKKLVTKQQLAKNYAKKKDGEVTELVTKLEQERKRYRRREHELEQQNKEYQERLRQAMAENFSASVEITALKNRIATLEKSMVAPSSEVFESKASFRIYEDSSKDANNPPTEDTGPEASYLSQKARAPPAGKENSPPKPRHMRRQTLPETSSRPPTYTATLRIGAEPDQASTILAKSPRASARAADAVAKSTLTLPSAGEASKSPFSVRKIDVSSENQALKSPATIMPSSPLPQPSPDPWMMNGNESSFGSVDKMALPMVSGPSYSRPARSSQPRRHGVSKSVSHPSKAAGTKSTRPTESHIAVDTKATTSKAGTVPSKEEKVETNNPRVTTKEDGASTEPRIATSTSSQRPSSDPKFDVARITSHHAEGSSQVKRERVQLLPVDRKEEARRRLMERKQKKLLSN